MENSPGAVYIGCENDWSPSLSLRGAVVGDPRTAKREAISNPEDQADGEENSINNHPYRR